jgi:trans-2-enoyl-CoA reductase
MRSNAPRCVCVYPNSAMLGLACKAPTRLSFAIWVGIFFGVPGEKRHRLSAGNDHLFKSFPAQSGKEDL